MTDPSQLYRDPAVLASHSALATACVHGMASGNAAATTDTLYFSGALALIAAEWAASRAGSDMQSSQPLAEQEEYFVARVHGYVIQAEQIEGAPSSWEDAAGGDGPPDSWCQSPFHIAG